VNSIVALLHFHSHFDLCAARIGLLRHLNPALEIHGLYGGETANLTAARRLEQAGLQLVFHDPTRSAAWNKKNTDLAVAQWFRAVGISIPFDRLHVIQWDLLFFAPLNRVYPTIPDGAVALSGLVPLSQIAHFWDWTAHSPLAEDSERLLEMARRRFGYRGEPFACIGPGYSLSRTFLERYSEVELDDDVGHDELRLPLFAQILGCELADTGFYPRWMDPDVESVFNADAHEVDPSLLERELARVSGRRVFHPCRERFDAEAIEYLLGRTRPRADRNS
jgi:hypothetical protein